MRTPHRVALQLCLALALAETSLGCAGGGRATGSDPAESTPEAPVAQGRLPAVDGSTLRTAEPLDPETRFRTGVRQSSGFITVSPGSQLNINATGSTGGRMSIAGLTFTENCQITFGDDYSVFVDRENVVVTDGAGKRWVSRSCSLGGQHRTAFFPVLE